MKRTMVLSAFYIAAACSPYEALGARLDVRAHTGKYETHLGSSAEPLKAFLALRQGSFNTEKSARTEEPCIDHVTLTFDRAVNMATVYGKVYSVTQYKSKKPLLIESHSPDFRTFVFKLPTSESCPQPSFYQNLYVSKEIHSVDGKKISSDVHFQLDRPSGRLRGTGSPSMELATALREGDRPSLEARARELALRPSSSPFAWVAALPGCKGCLRVKPAVLNRALAAVNAWTLGEMSKTWYRRALTQVPLEGTRLVPYTVRQRHHQYGGPDLIFLLRRAAKFVEFLFPDVQAIALADVSDSKGGTPSASLGSETILLHPEGSHRGGQDADVSYITEGSGHGKGAAYDFEKNFWFLYSVLQSSGVDMVITAFKDEMLALGQRAYGDGLITDIALGRFNMLMNDTELNHDKHVHISVRNADNNYRSRRFQPSDNVYTCYLALQPGRRGGNLNFCKGR